MRLQPNGSRVRDVWSDQPWQVRPLFGRKGAPTLDVVLPCKTPRDPTASGLKRQDSAESRTPVARPTGARRRDRTTTPPLPRTGKPRRNPGSLPPDPKDNSITSNSISDALEPISSALEPISSALEPISGAPKPISRALQPISRSLQPISGALEPISGALEPISGALEPISGAPEPISGAPEPISGAPKPISGALEPISKGDNGAAASGHAVMGVHLDLPHLRVRGTERHGWPAKTQVHGAMRRHETTLFFAYFVYFVVPTLRHAQAPRMASHHLPETARDHLDPTCSQSTGRHVWNHEVHEAHENPSPQAQGKGRDSRVRSS